MSTTRAPPGCGSCHTLRCTLRPQGPPWNQKRTTIRGDPMHDDTPPPGEVFDLAERAVEYVRKAMGQVLDYTPETLPLLDYYLRGIPMDREEIVDLIARTAGAYFGEVARKAIGGVWQQDGTEWRLVLGAGITLTPAAMAAEAIAQGSVGDYDATFDVPDDHRGAVEDALSDREVPEEEYYSLSGRLETLTTVAELIAARR